MTKKFADSSALWQENVLNVQNCLQFRCAARYPPDRCHHCLKDHTTAICFLRKNAQTEKPAINSQLGGPILHFWESRGPGSISARLAYLAANLKTRKLGVVKITWILSRIPKTSNFEKKIIEGNASRRIPSRMATNLSKSLYYGNTVFSKNERRAHRKADRAAAP